MKWILSYKYKNIYYFFHLSFCPSVCTDIGDCLKPGVQDLALRKVHRLASPLKSCLVLPLLSDLPTTPLSSVYKNDKTQFVCSVLIILTSPSSFLEVTCQCLELCAKKISDVSHAARPGFQGNLRFCCRIEQNSITVQVLLQKT